MRLLVTGAAGFIGSHFVRHALVSEPGAKVAVLDALRYSGNRSTMADFADRVEFFHGEIQDASFVEASFRAFRPTHVVNFAAESHNDRSFLDAGGFVETNVLGVQVLFEASRRHGADRVLHVSTDEVYGSILQGRFTEESPFRPNTPYSAAKAGGDLLCRAYFKSFGLPVIVTRGGNTYGPFHFPEKLVPFFCTRLLRGKKVPLYGEGGQSREWIHVADHASGIWAAMTKGEPGEAYNVGDDNERTNLAVVSAMLDELGLDKGLIKRIPDPRRGGHDSRYSMDAGKLRALGWAPTISFEEGLRATVRWFRDREDWWGPLYDRGDSQEFFARFYGASLGDDL
ncbi:MAG: dTDP-glucose 4,6-dehydratase [Fimbriimonadaceae bacterium]|nr:dTDP-glucose 4,6-dehydratase [Fimbriimonadaceae bacterium]